MLSQRNLSIKVYEVGGRTSNECPHSQPRSLEVTDLLSCFRLDSDGRLCIGRHARAPVWQDWKNNRSEDEEKEQGRTYSVRSA
jgi:hypothetical protein